MVFKLKLGKNLLKEENYDKYKTLTLARLNEVLDINPETGECYWKIAIAIRIKIGDRAGYIWKSLKTEDLYYRKIQIDGKLYLEHILIWFFVTKKWPPRDLDHKDRDGLNNKFKNLRLCTNSQNQGNTIKYKNNTSGYKGVYWDKRRKKWRAQIWYKGKRINSKGYDDPYEAHLWYCKMHKKLFGEFSRTK
jgi:hypothetical protein